MRLLFLLVLSASALQGCTVVGAGIARSVDRRHHAEARMTVAETAARPPAPGDHVTLTFSDGSVTYVSFVSIGPDSVRTDSGAFALADVQTIERPWVRTNQAVPILSGLAIDVFLGVLAGRALGDAFSW